MSSYELIKGLDPCLPIQHVALVVWLVILADLSLIYVLFLFIFFYKFEI